MISLDEMYQELETVYSTTQLEELERRVTETHGDLGEAIGFIYHASENGLMMFESRPQFDELANGYWRLKRNEHESSSNLC